MDSCIFCKIVKKELSSYKVYEDENTLAFLDIYPVIEGHTLIIPKKHFENILDIEDEELNNVMKATKKVAELVKKKLNADAINVLHASGVEAGQTVFHIHFHVVPRFKNDGVQMWPHHRAGKIDLKAVHEKLTLDRSDLSVIR